MSSDLEPVIRAYLDALRDPITLVDQDQVQELNQQIATADDPIEQLRLISQKARLEEADISELEAAFVDKAKAWADHEEVLPAAFLSLGVPSDVLVQAGFEEEAKASRRSAPARRRSRVSIKTIRDQLPKTPFTVAALGDSTGASQATIRKAIQSFVDDGLVKSLGADPEWSGRGRAPERFERV